MKGFYVYKFLNENNDIIYIGLTTNLKNRLTQQHFTKAGHLYEDVYNETSCILYSECLSKDDMKIKERYLINKHSPKYNFQLNNNSSFNFEINDFVWKQFNMTDYKISKPTIKNIVKVNLIVEKSNFPCVVVNNEGEIIRNYNYDEKNNFLIYNITRYSQMKNIQDDDTLLGKYNKIGIHGISIGGYSYYIIKPHNATRIIKDFIKDTKDMTQMILINKGYEIAFRIEYLEHIIKNNDIMNEIKNIDKDINKNIDSNYFKNVDIFIKNKLNYYINLKK